MSFIDALLHPVRLRIVLALAAGQPLTARQLAHRLPDEAPASLYRHLHRLETAGVVVVTATHRVRGATEKEYGLDTDNLRLTDADVADLSPEEVTRYFTLYLMSQIGMLQQAMTTNPAFRAKDMYFVEDVVELSDDEVDDFVRERDAWQARLHALSSQSTALRQPRLISFTIFTAPPAPPEIPKK